ncbi:Heat shock protein GrpE [hydrothermal vent metagenome]|uniref:Heat shock protein GrpE n=1 Tax=hydrothermal vent metagenome TaxID=652676 RepID=A0A3B1CC70_9ZZZZ
MGKNDTTEQEQDSFANANGEDIVDISGDSASLNAEDETSEPVAEESEKDPMELLQDELKTKDDEIIELKHEFLLHKAETENFKKRLRKEKEDFSQYANEKILKELIEINDNLERAFSATNPTVASMKEGVEMILKQFHSLMEKQNVEIIEALGKKFDPAIHEVLSQMESDEHEENTVTQEFSKGYQLNGRILRPSKVVIAKAPTKQKPEDSDEDKSSQGEPPSSE